MWHFDNSTFDQNPLTDAYMDYCFHQYGELIRHYKRSGGKTKWGFAQFCLQSFVKDGERMAKYRFSKIEKAYMKDAITYLQTHAVSLWQDYEDNPEYRKELGLHSSLWARSLKDLYRKPPTNHYELDLVFGALECFMLIEEKNLL
jgi:hypothetical protein